MTKTYPSPRVKIGPTILPRYGSAPGFRQTNEYDLCLARDKAVFDKFFTDGEAARWGDIDFPWVTMPSQGRRIREIGKLQAGTLEPFNGTDTTVLSFQVPVGYDGVIDTVICNILPGGVATGFIEGSGTVIWRLSANGRFLRDCGNLLFQLGDLKLNTTPDAGSGLRVYSGDNILFTVAIAATGIGVITDSSTIVCACMGWFYPR